MRRASELECRRLNDNFAALCAIPSPSRKEGLVAEFVRRELEQIGLEVEEDDVGTEIGGESGNLFAKLPAAQGEPVLFCAHLDTVPHQGTVQPVFKDGVWRSEGETILGADNKAAVAVLLELARRAQIEASPRPIELCFTVAEEVGLVGSSALDLARFESTTGFVYDHASPVGEIIVASPTHIRWRANLRGKAAHAGLSPELGRNAITAAASAIMAIPDGRLDPQTTANVARISGGVSGTNVVPEYCSVDGEVRALEEQRAEQLVAAVAEAFEDAANRPESQCDLDLTIERSFLGYQIDRSGIAIQAAAREFLATVFSVKKMFAARRCPRLEIRASVL
jgi:tripeptide aminopeptidase